MLAPVAIFAYKRLELLQRTINSLSRCEYADKTDIFIFCDGAKNENETIKIKKIKNYVETLICFNSITISFSQKNIGLANSVIKGVSTIHENHESVIVLEDDLVVSQNFLLYMNAALDFYAGNKKVFSISGYNIPMIGVAGYEFDTYFSPRASSWGWASWKDRWQQIDWTISDFTELKKNKQQIKAFNKGGSDLFNMLDKKMNNKIDSWAIRWCYSQFKNNLFTVYPISSKVQNIGFDNEATNSNAYNRYHTQLDKSNLDKFNFPDDVKLHPEFYSQFLQFYSLKSRFFSRLMTILFKIGLISNKF